MDSHVFNTWAFDRHTPTPPNHGTSMHGNVQCFFYVCV
jgi:hypothetical protein